MNPVRRRLGALLAGGTAVVLLAAGCGTQSADTSAAPSADTTARATAPTAPAASPASGSPAPPTGAASSPPVSRASRPTPGDDAAGVGALPRGLVARSTGLRGRLLTAAAVPPLVSGAGWRLGRTRSESSEPLGECQRTPLVTIGAQQATVRAFRSAADPTAQPSPTATQVVAEFADPKSAWRAHQVLTAWAADCAALHDFADEQVSPVSRVRGVSRGVGHHFVLAYRPAGGAPVVQAAYGVARVGRFLSVVRYTTTSPRWSYPDGKEPEARAVRRISRVLAH